jgi:uncharacterized secreted repeat protein (TIGR03808 family)
MDCVLTGSVAKGAHLRIAAGRSSDAGISDAGPVGSTSPIARHGGARHVVSECGNTGILVSRDDESDDDTIVRGNRVASIRARSGGTGQYGNGINVSKANGVIVGGTASTTATSRPSAASRRQHADQRQPPHQFRRDGDLCGVRFRRRGGGRYLIDGAAFGVSIVNFAEHGGRLATCSGNVIRNLSGVSRLPRGGDIVGTGIAAEADVAITGNVVENAARGIQLGWGPHLRDLAATGNVIRAWRWASLSSWWKAPARPLSPAI